MKTLRITIAANITYSGLTYNSPLICEYEHTGRIFYTGRNHCTFNSEIAEEWRIKGKRVTEKPGYYFIKRLAIPTINAIGKHDIWYINNDGDTYSINKVSKYGKKIHSLLSNNINPFNN